ncbi:proline-rich receptor-like protein kinase PERK13 [Carex littledalei]|uniref:non-specific serine/threonine protein kinase n=1 Tax=Carex littledalei TaxID=544730 RepID=A0A833RHK8_9POAL|nr:proline-rich receptor-like protein kinase PERK13 [Carex littledalei]
MSNSTNSLFLSPNPSPTIEFPTISPPPSQTGINQLTPPPPAVNQFTPPPPSDVNQLPLPSPSVNQLPLPSPSANQLTPPPPNAIQLTPPPPNAIQLTPPPPGAIQLASPPPGTNQLTPPPFVAGQLDPELIENKNTPNPQITKSPPPIPPPLNTVPVPVLPPPPANPVSVPVQITPPDLVQQPPPSISSPSITPFQPLPVPSPPPPVDPLIALPPPAVPVPVQVQTPPSPPFPNPIFSPLTNPTDTSSVPAVHVESPPTRDSSTMVPQTGTSDSSPATIGIALVAGFMLFCLMYLFVVCVKRLRRNWATKFPGQYKTMEKNAGPVSSTNSNLDSNGGFSYQHLYDMTGGFSDTNLIGEGGFAHVYKGWLPNGTEVAVKKIKQEKAAEQELRSEMEIIGRIHHRHLVKFLGYCFTGPYQLLVYEFVPNQTLSYHLHEEGLPVLDWQKRMKIAIGSARGLKYLHEDCEPKIVHRDIKSANILLDNSFEPKIADFGLAKLTYDSNTHVSTRVMGTYGYLAPEYAITGKLTYKSDVFSFGVVLLELITGRKAINPSDPEENLVGWAWPLLVEAINNGKFENLVDPKLKGNYIEKEMSEMANVAASCVRHSAANRLSMPQVLKALESGCNPSDLCNGVWFGDSTAFDSRQYSLEIENFQKREFWDAGVSIRNS